MSETPAPLYRCTCPHCQKVLKIRLEWAGKRGTCPQCRKVVEFPAFRAPSSKSATTQHLLKLVAAEDEATLDDAQADRLAMLLSQGTCTDYRMADSVLDDRTLSPRQWRRILNAADGREAMRLRLESCLEDAETHGNGDDEPLAVLAAADAATPNAWKILARFVYFQRHGTCDPCEANPTGMACIYRTFESFLALRHIPEDRAVNWKSLLHLHVGL